MDCIASTANSQFAKFPPAGAPAEVSVAAAVMAEDVVLAPLVELVG